MSNNNHELRDTAVIGATGAVSSGLAHPVTNALTGKGAKSVVPFAERLSNAIKKPISTVGTAIKSEGFKKGLAIGAVGGGLGLVGDYAAVKYNNHLNKQANSTPSASPNKYLEKLAETYAVRGNPGLGSGLFNTPPVNLDRNQYHQYARQVDSSWKPLGYGAGLGLTSGAVAAILASHTGGKPGLTGVMAGGLGSLLGLAIGENEAHKEALNDLDIMHPVLLDWKKEEN